MVMDDQRHRLVAPPYPEILRTPPRLSVHHTNLPYLQTLSPIPFYHSFLEKNEIEKRTAVHRLSIRSSKKVNSKNEPPSTIHRIRSSKKTQLNLFYSKSYVSRLRRSTVHHQLLSFLEKTQINLFLLRILCKPTPGAPSNNHL